MDETQAPRKISPSKLMGTDTPALGNVGQGGESKTGKLARILRTTRVKVNKNEKDIKVNIDKLMNVESEQDSIKDEQEQIHESIFNLVEKQAEQKKQGAGIKGVDALADSLNVIAKELTAINDLLARQLKNDARRAKKMAQEARKEERDKKEKESESVVKKVGKKVFDTIKKPFESFFDKILKFLTNIVLGTAVIGILDWLKKPENQQKVENFTNFVIDKMPLILGGIAAFFAIGLGLKMVGVIKAIVGGIKGLTFVLGLGGGTGLLAVLGAVAAFLAAKFIEDKVRPAVQDLVLGVGYTETGLMFRGEDIANLRDEQRKFLVQQGVSGSSLDQQLKKYDDLLDSMKSRKSINDQLAQVEKDIKRREEQIKRQRESGDTQSADRNQGILNDRIKRRDELKNNLEFANRQVTIGFSNLNVSESDLERDIIERGGTISRTPGAVAPDLRVNGGESDSGSVSFGKMGMEPMETANFGTDASMDTPTFGTSSSTETPRINISGAMNGDQKIDEVAKDFMSSSPLSVGGIDIGNSVLSTPHMFSGNKNMLYDIPTPKHFSETIVAPAVGGQEPGSGAAAMSSGARNDPPKFSPFDPNNPTLDPVLSVYNALV